MVRESVDLLELLRKQAAGGDLEFLREAVAVLAEVVMEAEVAAQIGAGHGERSAERTTWRNGYRPRRWDTRASSIELQIPKLRQGSYFPALLEPRRRAERALLAVVQQAYVEGVSTRRVDDLVRSLGCEGISKSQVSRICSELDSVVTSFLERPLDGGPYRYLWLDALTQRVREEGRITQVSVVVATAVNADGKRGVLGIDVGTSEDGAFWLSFLRVPPGPGRAPRDVPVREPVPRFYPHSRWTTRRVRCMEAHPASRGALPAQPRPRWDRRSVAVAHVRHHVRGWSSLLARRSPPPAAIPSMLCGLAGRGVA